MGLVSAQVRSVLDGIGGTNDMGRGPLDLQAWYTTLGSPGPTHRLRCSRLSTASCLSHAAQGKGQGRSRHLAGLPKVNGSREVPT
jgi:hypothetical protein